MPDDENRSPEEEEENPNPTEQDESEDDASGEDTPGEESEEQSEEDEAKGDASEESDEGQKPEPKQKSPRDYILERKAKKYDQIKGTKEKTDGGDAKGSSATPTSDPVLEILKSQADEQELQSLFIKHPEAIKLEQEIRRHMDAYKDTPAEFIYMGLVAQRGGSISNPSAVEEAKKAAKAKKTGGNRPRPKAVDSNLKNADELSEEEFQAQVNKVMTGR